MEKIKPSKADKEDEPKFNAYAIVKGNGPIQFRLIRLEMQGKQMTGVDVVLEEILPVVIAKVEHLLRQESLPC